MIVYHIMAFHHGEISIRNGSRLPSGLDTIGPQFCQIAQGSGRKYEGLTGQISPVQDSHQDKCWRKELQNPWASPHVSQNSLRANVDRVLARVLCRFAGDAGSTPCKDANPTKSASASVFRSAVEICETCGLDIDWKYFGLIQLQTGSERGDSSLPAPIQSNPSFGHSWHFSFPIHFRGIRSLCLP